MRLYLYIKYILLFFSMSVLRKISCFCIKYERFYVNG